MNAQKNFRLSPFLWALLLFTIELHAQTASLAGRVTDSTGAVLQETKVVVTQVATGIERTVYSSGEGYYAAPLLPPGEYRITAEKSGFRTVSRSGVILQVDQRAQVDFELLLGTVADQVEVTADALQLSTSDASQGQVIENRRITEMPLNGRDYNQLALLSSGAVQPLSGARYGGFSSGGLRVTQNNFLLDGIDNNGVELAGAQRQSEMVKPSVDAIQEFKVQTNSYSSEYGRAMGSVVNVTTKSGTNDIHGTAFEFLRNEKLDAKNFFDPADRDKPPFKRNQYGFSVGGPLYIPKFFDGRNKVFWFGDYEGTKIRESSTITSTIPTVGMRSGDFGDLLTQRGQTIRDPQTNLPFVDNVIPSFRQDPVSQRLLALYPNPQNSNLSANYVSTPPLKQDLGKFDMRFDVVLGSRDTVSYRYSQQDLLSPAALALPPPAFSGEYDSNVQGKNTGATWNHIFSPSLILSLRGGWNFALFKRDNPAATNRELLNQKYGIPGGNSTIPGGFSSMGITGYRSIGLGGFNPVDRDSQNRQLSGDLTWTASRHTVKFGGSVLRLQNNIFNIRNEIGNYSFNSRYTTDGAADFLLGLASAYNWNTRLQVDLRGWNYAGYVQDDWRVTPKLTVNLGLRYEVTVPFSDKYDRMGILDNYTDPTNPRLIYAGSEGNDTYNRAMIATDRNNFMPRLGLAYKLNEKTVVRAGYGVFFMLFEPMGDAEFLIGNPPSAFGVSLSSSATTPAVILRDGPPDGSLTLARASGLTFVL